MGLGKPINNQIPYHISLHIKTTKFLIKKKKLMQLFDTCYHAIRSKSTGEILIFL